MKPAPFQYHAPKTIDEAVETLARVAGEDGRVLAGGQSLVPIMAFRLARPGHLVDINGVTALRRLAADRARLSKGACVRHAAINKPHTDGPQGRLLATTSATLEVILAILDSGRDHREITLSHQVPAPE